MSRIEYQYKGFRYCPDYDYQDDCTKVFHDCYFAGRRFSLCNAEVPGLKYVSAYRELTEEQFRAWVDKHGVDNGLIEGPADQGPPQDE